MSLRPIAILAVIGIFAYGFFAWNKNREAPPSAQQQEQQAPAPDAGGMPGGAIESAPAADAGVTWDKPDRWLLELGREMRLATFTIPGSGGAAKAECAVYYFGPGQGGGVDANLERWAGEFVGGANPERSTLTADGMKVTRVKLRGTYQAHAGMSQGASGPQPDHMLLGAIVEGPNGPLFLKLIGPAATVSPAEKEFDGLLRSLKKTASS
jgi:hypothetical protein